MVDKKVVLFLVLFLVFTLSISTISAGWFNNFWNKITGNAVDENMTITYSEEMCGSIKMSDCIYEEKYRICESEWKSGIFDNISAITKCAQIYKEAQGGKVCSDGTLINTCSINKPLFCNSYLELINNCSSCGCNQNKLCLSNGACESPQQNNENFVLVHSGSYTGKKIKLYFINFGYDNYSLFEHDVDYALFADDTYEGMYQKGFFNVEPFKAHKERFDIYLVNRNLIEEEIGCSTNNPENPCSILAIQSFAKSQEGLNLGQCNFVSTPSTFIDGFYALADCNIIISFVDGLSGGGGGGNDGYWIAVNHDPNNPKDAIKNYLLTSLHEAGHMFKVVDEYNSGYRQGSDYSDLDYFSKWNENTNCDIYPGCPKWCNGSAKSIQRSDNCKDFSSYATCEANTYDDCIWLTNPELTNYFGSNCIPESPVGDISFWNSGNQCEEGEGCFYGCSGAGWRSTQISLYGDSFGTPEEWNIYSQEGLEPYNRIQKNIIGETIELVTNDVSGEDKPMTNRIAREWMVSDIQLSELSEFTFGGMWNFWKTDNEIRWHIDLRYINVDQRSEFALDIINLDLNNDIMVPLPDSFLDDEYNQAQSLWGNIQLRETNGKKFYEGYSKAPAGTQRYVFWISDDKFIRGWNGNDEGTVIDNGLFDKLLVEYLKKYPSTYTGLDNGQTAGVSSTDVSENTSNPKDENLFSKIVQWFNSLFSR